MYTAGIAWRLPRPIRTNESRKPFSHVTGLKYASTLLANSLCSGRARYYLVHYGFHVNRRFRRQETETSVLFPRRDLMHACCWPPPALRGAGAIPGTCTITLKVSIVKRRFRPPGREESTCVPFCATILLRRHRSAAIPLPYTHAEPANSMNNIIIQQNHCLLYTSPSPRD